MAIEISVVLPTYNRREMLAKCLDSLFRQSYPKDRFEIIVADNNSTDGTAELVKSLAATSPCNLKYAFEEKRGSIPKTRNAGIRAAEAEVVAFIDSDAYPDENWLAELKDWLDMGEISIGDERIMREKIASVSGKVVIGNPGSLIARYSEYGTYRIFGLEQGDAPYAGPPTGHPTCNTAYRRRVLDEIGLFDERLTFAAEDDDLGAKASGRGYLHVYNPKAVVYHNHPDSVWLLAKRWYRMASSQPLYMGREQLHNALTDYNPFRIPSRRFLTEYWYLIPVDMLVRCAMALGLAKSFFYRRRMRNAATSL